MPIFVRFSLLSGAPTYFLDSTRSDLHAWHYDFGIAAGVHSMCVFEGSIGKAQKKPIFCMSTNMSFPEIAIVLHSSPSGPSRHISATGLSRGALKRYVADGEVLGRICQAVRVWHYEEYTR